MKSSSSNFKKLVHLLNDSEFHSGAQLGIKLNISRNAVWKVILKLLQFGINVESSKQKGYKLNQPLILLESKIIKSYIEKSLHQKIEKIFLLESIGSTNDYLKSVAIKNPNKIRICLSEHQTAGKGRLGRTWESPFGANIYLSIGFKSPKDTSQLSGLSIAIGLSIIHVLKIHTQKNEWMMKWPNDIFWGDEKIGGILIEIQAESHGNTDIIIGVGLNVNQHSKSCRLSIEKILNQPQDRNILAALIINSILKSLEKFDALGLDYFISDYHLHDYLYQKPIQLTLHQQKAISGIASGINALGHLLVEDTTGKISAYSAGDASLHDN